jgi:hypothetical protein
VLALLLRLDKQLDSKRRFAELVRGRPVLDGMAPRRQAALEAEEVNKVKVATLPENDDESEEDEDYVAPEADEVFSLIPASRAAQQFVLLSSWGVLGGCTLRLKDTADHAHGLVCTRGRVIVPHRIRQLLTLHAEQEAAEDGEFETAADDPDDDESALGEKGGKKRKGGSRAGGASKVGAKRIRGARSGGIRLSDDEEESANRGAPEEAEEEDKGGDANEDEGEESSSNAHAERSGAAGHDTSGAPEAKSKVRCRPAMQPARGVVRRAPIPPARRRADGAVLHTQVDDLWEEMKRGAAVKREPAAKRDVGEYIQSMVAKAERNGAAATTPGAAINVAALFPATVTKKATYTEVKTVDFAGEKVQITKKVEVGAAEEGAQPGKRGAAQAPRKSRLEALVARITGKKATVTTIAKTEHDWGAFKRKEGLEDELATYRKDGYLEKQRFLRETDARAEADLSEQRRKEREARDKAAHAARLAGAGAGM